jgi:hypothetical protein
MFLYRKTIALIHYHMCLLSDGPAALKRVHIIQKILLRFGVEPCIMDILLSVGIGVAKKMRFWDQDRSMCKFLRMFQDYKDTRLCPF